ncbi:MlaD family protein [Acidiferrimicrobium sp. IK]|uniref:MlaD family protein n=1 Tax=Acidiferrimicrobium sp. IK TaxID=2871700 RepID=UPI0021CB030D|nr:MlaD family protein [Acidiferrimicrobium sp. IK]MCU4184407.1 MlaD family protein [Acidiferrimicrobium sp. IK]
MSTISIHRREGRRKGGRLRGIRTYLGSRPGLGRNLFTIIAAIVVGLVVAVFIISQEQLILPWQHERTIYAVFSDASAIAPGQHQEVRVAGVHVGQIGNASVTKGGDAKVGMEITDSSLKVYANATALLQAKTPLNEMYISLNPGTPAAPLLKSGQTIPVAQTQSPVEIDQILQHLGPNQQNAQRILLSETNIALDNASQSIPKDLTSASNGLSSLQPVAAALATRQSEIKQLVTTLNQIAQAIGGNDARLASLITHAQTTLTTLSANNTDLQKTLAALPGTTDALGTSLGKVQALSGQLNPFLDNLRAADGVLPGALNKLTTTLNQLKPVVDELGPVITTGTPVVNSARSLLVDANPALANLTHVTPLLNPITAYLGYDAPWLQGFFFHTASVGSLTVNTPNGRQQVIRAVVGSGSGTLNFLGGACSVLGPSGSSLISTIGSVVKALPQSPLPISSYLPAACGGNG